MKGNLQAKKNQEETRILRLLEQGEKVDETVAVKYAEMLTELLRPFKPSNHDELEEMIGLGIVAWNMSIVKEVQFPGNQKMLDNMLRGIQVNKQEKKTISIIMEAKLQKYPDHVHFISDYEIIPEGKESVSIQLTVKTFSDFLAPAGEEEEEIPKLQFEEGFINRNGIVVGPRPPFWDWVKGIDPEFVIPASSERTVYLIHEKGSDSETTAWIKKNFDKIFVEQLSGWFTDANLWPGKRTYKMFMDFFEVEYCSMVMDLEKEPVIKD